MESEDEQRPVLASDHPPKKITLHGYLNTLAPKHVTGCFYKLVPPLNYPSSKSLYILWHLEKFQRSFYKLVPPPKLSKYKIPLYPLAFIKISEDLTRDFVLKKFWGGSANKTTLYIAAQGGI